MFLHTRILDIFRRATIQRKSNALTYTMKCLNIQQRLLLLFLLLLLFYFVLVFIFFSNNIYLIFYNRIAAKSSSLNISDVSNHIKSN